ncbi:MULTISPECIES: CGNR zinc finger domain-containing protein [Streptomyces]|nr:MULTISPECIES: CGNR zinc finger domain-containing protein [Streptomyces]
MSETAAVAGTADPGLPSAPGATGRRPWCSVRCGDRARAARTQTTAD